MPAYKIAHHFIHIHACVHTHTRTLTQNLCALNAPHNINHQSIVCISDEYEDDEDFVSTDEEMDTPDRSVSKSSSVRAENSFDSLDSRDDHQVGRGSVPAGFDETV